MRYPLSTVLFSYQSALDYYAAAGTELTPEVQEQLVQETLAHFVGLGLIENKLREAGQDKITETEEQILRTYAQNAYESVWQGLYQQLAASGEAVTEAEVSLWLEEQGYTVDAFYREAVTSERYRRILTLYCSDVAPTPEQIMQYYQEQFVTPDQTRYQDNIPLYEEEILLAGNEAFYTPEGYRYIKHILLPYPDEIVQALEEIDVRTQAAEAERMAAYDALAQAAAAGEDIAPYKAAYDEKVAALNGLLEEYGQKSQEALPALKDKTDEILGRFEQGEEFEALMQEYSLDPAHQDKSEPGFLFHPRSENWAENFRTAAAALEQPGDISRPVLTSAGVHLILYIADVPSGPPELTAEETDALNRSALQTYQLEKLNALMEDWRTEYDIVTDASLLQSK
ncbi:MAG: peptidylprolyl isomerase [Eubacteriales bacterium]|nr:peptidylprolyl isomerase [Eubacteriales bacterium]